MAEFTNEFRVNEIPESFVTFSVGFDKRFGTQRKFDYKAASQASRKLSDEMRVSVASLGGEVVTRDGVQLPPAVTVTMKIDGLPTDVEITLHPAKKIGKGDPDYAEAARKYLNRHVDVILRGSDYRQEARGFFEESSKDVGPFYTIYEGIHVSSRFNDGVFTLVVDPVTQVRAKLNLLDMLNQELKKREIKDWSDAGKDADDINKSFRGKAFNLRSTYVEPQRDEPHHNVYRFGGFRFDKGVGASKDPRSPVVFHQKFGRDVSPNQPIVEVVAQDGRKVDHVPSLLEQLPSSRTLKRFGVWQKVRDRSLKDANTRFYMTSDLLKPLIEANLIEPTPIQVGVDAFGPVRITVEGDHIDLNSNRDFQTIFKKKKLLKGPSIDSVAIFSSKEDASDARVLLKELVKVFRAFELSEPKVVEKLDCPANLEGFHEELRKNVTSLKPAAKDLVLVVFGFEDEDLEEATYVGLKRDSLEHLFPVQFVNTDSIKEAIEAENVREGLANPLFLQIVAKCGGQPYGLQPGFVRPGTAFMGIDKYRQPFKVNAPTVMSVTIFDSEGAYICGDSDVVSYEEWNVKQVLTRLLNECYATYKAAKKADASLLIFLTDMGIGTMSGEFNAYVQACREIVEKSKAEYVFASGNKNSHLRLYSGDPSDFALTAERVSPFTAALDMNRKEEVLVVSTEPIVSKKLAKQFGTPKAVLYDIVDRKGTDSLEDTKRLLAKSVVWLCRHAWISPASTREPAPIFFANKLSQIVAATGVRITPDRTTAPLFL